MPHECPIAGVLSTAALTTENDTEGKDSIYNHPKAGKISSIKSDKGSAEFI